MFGILVGHPNAQPHYVSSTADTAVSTRRLTRMFNVIAWLPVIALVLKKAV